MPEAHSGMATPPVHAAGPRPAPGPGAAPGNLPRPLTSFIGREHELGQAKGLLQCSHLVTLTGPGGSGKTRLCIALAAAVATDYPDGVGMIQAVNQTWQGAACGAVYDVGTNWCSPTVYFEPLSNVLNSFFSLNPTLDTGGQH